MSENASLPALNERQPSKKYRESTEAIVADALDLVKKQKAEGWTRDDFAAGLKTMLESTTGNEDRFLEAET